VTFNADNTFTTEGSTGEGIMWSLQEENTHLLLNGTGGGAFEYFGISVSETEMIWMFEEAFIRFDYMGETKELKIKANFYFN